MFSPPRRTPSCRRVCPGHGSSQELDLPAIIHLGQPKIAQSAAQQIHTEKSKSNNDARNVNNRGMGAWGMLKGFHTMETTTGVAKREHVWPLRRTSVCVWATATWQTFRVFVVINLTSIATACGHRRSSSDSLGEGHRSDFGP